MRAEELLALVIEADGHMAGDSVGVNQVIKLLEREGLAVTRASGGVDPYA